MDAELRRANALLAATRRLQSAVSAILAAPSIDELDRTIVDVLPGAIGFERVALLAPPTMYGNARIVQELGYPALDLSMIPKNSPLAVQGIIDAQRTGTEDDDDLPHGDVRGAYVLSPLRVRDRVVAALYADSLREDIELADAAGSVAYALEIAGMVRANLSLSAELADLARTDGLTGLPNRRVFDERLEDELRRSARSRRPFALAIFDVDRFKQINDTHGHRAGDEALRAFAETLRKHTRHVDLAARFAGDEFAMILLDVDHGEAHAIVARIVNAIRELCPVEALRLSTSAGVTLSYPVDTSETIIERADAALYKAKQAGRDRAVSG
jgi:diguanylate cyclase (GGDEF)-like protein